MFLPALPCLRRLKQAMVVVLPEGFRSLKRTLARLDPDEKLTISVIYPCFPWFSFDALGLFYESRLVATGRINPVELNRWLLTAGSMYYGDTNEPEENCQV